MQSLNLPRRVGVTGLGPRNLGSVLNIAIPVAVAALAASAAYAGADTTFTPALTKFTYIVCSLYVLTRFGYRRIEK